MPTVCRAGVSFLPTNVLLLLVFVFIDAAHQRYMCMCKYSVFSICLISWMTPGIDTGGVSFLIEMCTLVPLDGINRQHAKLLGMHKSPVSMATPCARCQFACANDAIFGPKVNTIITQAPKHSLAKINSQKDSYADVPKAYM